MSKSNVEVVFSNERIIECPEIPEPPESLMRFSEMLERVPRAPGCPGCPLCGKDHMEPARQSYAESKRGFGGNTTPRKAPRK